MNNSTTTTSLINLPTEIINKILLIIIEEEEGSNQNKNNNNNNNNYNIGRLLSIHPNITPLIERILFNSITIYQIDSNINRPLTLLLNCLASKEELEETTTTTTTTIDSEVGNYIQHLTIKALDYEEDLFNRKNSIFWRKLDQITTRIESKVEEAEEILEFEDDLSKILICSLNLLSLSTEVDLNIITIITKDIIDLSGRIKDQRVLESYNELEYNTKQIRTKRRLDQAFNKMKELRTLILNPLRIEGELGILSNQIQSSPFIKAFLNWNQLIKLHLSYFYLSIPDNFNFDKEEKFSTSTISTSTTTSSPNYELKSLELNYCVFERISDLNWLLGISPTTNNNNNNHYHQLKLETLILNEVEIESESNPTSSSPLLSIFYPPSPSTTIKTNSFFHTLTTLVLNIRHPPSSSPSESSSTNNTGTGSNSNSNEISKIFTPFTSLKFLTLEGKGITFDFLESLLPPPPINKLNQITPSSTLEKLNLNGTKNLIPLYRLIHYFKSSTTTSSSSSSSSTYSNSVGNNNWVKLKSLEFCTELKGDRFESVLNPTGNSSSRVGVWELETSKESWNELFKWCESIPTTINTNIQIYYQGSNSSRVQELRKGIVILKKNDKIIEGLVDIDLLDEEDDEEDEEEEEEEDESYVSEREVNRGRF